MEQRNQLLDQMKLTARQKRGDVQHLLGRSFSVGHAPPPSFQRSQSDVQEISIPVPHRRQTSPTTAIKQMTSPIAEEEETVSIGELSVEPRVLGEPRVAAEEPVQLIDLSSYPTKEEESLDKKEEEEEDGGVVSAPRRQRADSGTSSSSDEEESVHTPLLEAETSNKVLPVMSRPGIKRYDDMFSEQPPEEEIPLGGTADNLTSQP